MQAAEGIRRWREDPVAFVREVFRVEPDAWQARVLGLFPKSPRLAMTACKGPGKTCVLAWLAWNFLLTRPHPKIAATSISSDNLTDGLWTEMAKWQTRSELLQAAFSWTKTRIYANDHPETWWMSARAWSKSADANQQADTLAGLHADYLLFILDEAGGIPDAVMAAAEAGLASGIECHLLMAGNPTHLEGPLYRANTSERHLWEMVHITGDPEDADRSPRVSIEWAQAQIDKYGRDNPWVLVNVFGRFPPSSLNALLGPDEVRAAMGKHLRPDAYEFSAKVLGVDVSLYGDDSSVIFPRQGLAAFEPIILRNVGPMVGAGHVGRKWGDWQADACFIDATGGFGDPWAAALEDVGRSPIRVQFHGPATSNRYYNKRAEMWFEMAEWVRNGGALPNIPELVAELTQTTYTFKGDKLLLEPKADVKAKLGRSPDLADALALTFAYPVLPGRASGPATPHQTSSDYDPYSG